MIDQARLGEAVGQIARGRREDAVGHDEQRAGERGKHRAAHAEPEQGEYDEGVLDQVVVQGTAGLGEHERPHATGFQQRKRSGHDAALQHMATINLLL